MTPVPLENADPQIEIVQGPGSRLRQARVAQGLELTKVASQMHLSASVLEALEHDDYDRLPGPVFVRGYLKSYARLMGIEGDPLVAAYARSLPIDSFTPPLANGARVNGARLKTETEGRHFLGHLIVGIVVLMLIVLAVIWWRGELSWRNLSQWGGSPSATQTPTLEEAESIESRSLSAPLEVGAANDEVPTEPSPLPLQVEETSVPDLAARPEEVRFSDSEEYGRPLPAPDAASEPDVDVETASVDNPADVVSSLGAADETETGLPPVGFEPTPAAGELTLEFVFSGSCWLDVRDASGAKKLMGVMPPGTRRTLSGKPPFALVLGNTSVVDLAVNGKPFDFSPFVRGNVARFQIDFDTLDQ